MDSLAVISHDHNLKRKGHATKIKGAPKIKVLSQKYMHRLFYLLATRA